MSEEERNFDDEEDFDYGEGVFTDNEGTEALRKSAQALGINPDLVAPAPTEDGEEPEFRYFARKGCKHCYGRGVLTVCISPSEQKVFWRNEGRPGRLTKRVIRSTKKLRKRRRQVSGPTRPRNKVITGVSLGNELGKKWDLREERPTRKPSKVINRLGLGSYARGTQQPEPQSYKEDNTSQSFCRCIRAIEV